MAEKNITMKRKTAQGWDVYYPKTKGGNIIQDGNNRLVTDAEKKVWNDALAKANKYTDERIESTYRIDLTKLDTTKAYPVTFDGYTEVLIRRKAHQDGDKNPNLSLYIHTMPTNWGSDSSFYEVIHRQSFVPEKPLVKKIFSNMESALTHVYLAGGYTYDIVNLLKFGKKAVVQEKDFTDPRGNKLVPVENLDSAMAQGYFRGTTECNITKDTSPEALLTNKEKADINNALTDVKTNWKQKHNMTFHDGTAIGLNANTDLNTILETGFYRGNKLVNAPTADAWHYLMVTKHTESYVMQVASVLDTGFHKDKNTLFIRHMINKVWTAWRAVSLREDWGLWGTNGGQDLLARGKRAMVAQPDDKLVVNYSGDFKNGVYVHSSLTTTGSMIAGNGLVNDKGYFEIGSYNNETYGVGKMQSFYDANNKAWKIHAKDDKNAPVNLKMQINGKDVATSDDIAKQVSKTGDTMSGNLNFDKTLNGITWNMNTDYAKVYFKNDSDADTDSYLAFETGDNGNEHFKWLTKNGATTSEMMRLNQSGLTVKGKTVAINEEVDAKLNKKLNKTSDTTDDLHMINPKVVAGGSDHGYLGFYPRTKEPTKRGAYMGYGSAGTNLLTISNEIGDVNINSQGKVLLNNKEVATKDEVSSLVASVGQKFKLTQDDGRAISASGKSFNELQAGGYYMGAEMKDAPLPSTSNWWFIEIMRHANGWVHQRATWFNTTTVETYERILHNNAWQPWKKTVTPQGWGLWRTNGGQDLLVHDKRAMVGFATNSGDRLELNYGKDFASGVNIQGKLTNDGYDVIHNGWNFMRDRSQTITVQQDWNAVTESGLYLVTDATGTRHASSPPNCYPYGVLEVYRTGSNQALFQRYTSHQHSQVFVRSAWAKASWSAWRRLADEDFVNAGDAKQVSKTGDTMTGSLNFDTNGGERRVFATSTDIDAGFYFNKTGLGLYDWKNKRSIFGLNPNTGQLNFEPIRLTKNGVDIATVNDVNNRVAKSGDTMTGQLTVNMSGDKSTPIVAQNAGGKLRILPYAGDDNYIQSGTTADGAKNLRITGYNGSQMDKAHIHATNTTTAGSLVVGKDINVSGGGTTASNIFFQDHTHIFSRSDRTGFHDTKNKVTSLAIDNGNKAIQIESGYNLRVINGGQFEAGNFAIRGQDLLVHGKRAMVGTPNDRIHINYGKDMPNGVVSNGKLQVNDGQLYVTQNGKDAVIGCGANDTYLRNSKSGKYLQLKDDGTLSYDGKGVALTDEASHVKWSTFTNFQNGFKPLPEGHALFYGIDQFGFKHIRGLVQGGSTNAGAVIGKLPDFMKPAYWTSITATYDTTGGASYVPCAMHVSWGGELIVQNSRSASSFIVINGLYK
ncbi:pyocin knob domain-containing protein [Bacillus anthracis]|uniref:pyocin knob domain-containing protein n=1 Tax=Bacillus anthracis TaxID=1392 RepID=UPI003D235237